MAAALKNWPHEFPLRRELEMAVERAIAALDAFDGDPDLEDGGDREPNLAQPDGARYSVVTERDATGRALRTVITDPIDQTHWSRGDLADLEFACEDEGAQCDDEGVCGLHDPDREDGADAEPDNIHECCHWQDEGDQTTLTAHSVHIWNGTLAKARPQAMGVR